jgi:hypothetical protein
MKGKHKHPYLGISFLKSRHLGDHRRYIPRPVLTTLPLRRTRDRAIGVVGPRHQRTVTTRIPSTLTISFLPLLSREMITITTPAAHSHLPFFAGRPSYPSTQLQSPHHTDSVFYASANPKRPSSCRKSAMRKDGAGVCAFPRAGYQRTWSTCLKSSRNSLWNWARRSRG